MAKRWKLDYFTKERKETTFHATRDAAMKALYGRLDLAQRDALAFGEQELANEFGRIRGAMASAWKDVVSKPSFRGVLYHNDVAHIVRNA